MKTEYLIQCTRSQGLRGYHQGIVKDAITGQPRIFETRELAEQCSRRLLALNHDGYAKLSYVVIEKHH